MRLVIVLSVLLLTICTSITAQTYVSIGTGWDFASIKRGSNFELREGMFYLTKETSIASNYFIQGTITQQLSSSSFLALAGVYMGHKEVAGSWFASAFPAEQICFNVWGIRATYRKELFRGFYAGGGLGTSFYSLRARLKSGTKIDAPQLLPNNISYDLPFVIGYQYKKFLFEGHFQLGLGYQKDYSELIEPFRSFGVSVNYLFKITDGK